MSRRSIGGTFMSTPGMILAPVLSWPRLRYDTDVRPRRFPALGIDLLGFLVGDGARNDHILALPPIHRGCDPVLRCKLQGIQHAEHLVEIAPRGHGIGNDEFDPLVRPDHE